MWKYLKNTRQVCFLKIFNDKILQRIYGILYKIRAYISRLVLLSTKELCKLYVL